MQLIWGLVVVATLVATTSYRIARICLVGACQLVSMLVRRRRDNDQVLVPSQEAAAPVAQARSIPGESVGPAGDADHRFAPADRIYHVAFSRGFTAKVYVYKARGEVRRVLSTTDAVLSRKMEYALMSTRIPLPTLSLREHSIETILRDTEVKGWEAIHKTIDGLRSIRHFGLADAPTAPLAEAVPIAGPPAEPVAAVDVPPAPVAAEMPSPPEAPGAAVSRRIARKGVAITGIVVTAQSKEALFNSSAGGRKSKGTTFEVTLDTAHGETSMRGVELRDECTRLGVKTGDRVSITPLGRQRVVSGENDKGYMKNLFKVELLERATT